jgi:hypothetical protein
MLATFAAGLLGLAAAPALAPALAALVVAGFGYLLSQTRATTLIQLGVDDAERGRVMALWSIAFLGTRPLASLVDGGLATWLGPRPAAALMAIPVVVAAALLFATPERAALQRPPATR